MALGLGAKDIEKLRRMCRAASGPIPPLEARRQHRDIAVGGDKIVFGVLTLGASGASGLAGFTAASLGPFGEITTDGDEQAVIVPRLQ